jgi:single-strand DNA-binding protein
MAASLNHVALIGNLGADPEVRTTPNGATCATFRVACSESWKDQSGQKQERTEWITVVAWRATAEVVQRYLRKGARVYVDGKLQTRSWDDKQTGAKRYATEVLCDRLLMLDGKPQSDHRDEPRRETGDNHQPPAQASNDDDLPF